MKPFLPLLTFLLLVSFALAADNVKKISPADAAKLVADGKAVLIDVREPSGPRPASPSPRSCSR